jgi:amino acid permease
MTASDVRPTLFNWAGAGDGAEVPDNLRSTVLEQYKLYLEMTDRISQRRQTANSFFVTLNTAVVGLLGYVDAKLPDAAERFYLLISFSGVMLCLLWYRLIRSYRDLNTAKFAVLHTIERLLPLKPYSAEWDYVGRGSHSRFYKPFTHVEINVPWLFFALYVVVMLWNAPWRFVMAG